MPPKSYFASFVNPPFQGVLEMDAFYQLCEYFLDQLQEQIWNEYLNNSYVTIQAKNQSMNLREPREGQKRLSNSALLRLEKIFHLEENQDKDPILRNDILHTLYSFHHRYTNPWIRQYLISICGVGNFRILQDNIAWTYTISLTKSAKDYQDMIYDMLWDKIPANFIFQVRIEVLTWGELQAQQRKWGDLAIKTWGELETLDQWDPAFYQNWGNYKNKTWNELIHKKWSELGDKL